MTRKENHLPEPAVCGHIEGFREEIARAAGDSPESFFNWFDSSGGIDASFVRGEWDFALHFAPHFARHIRTPEEKTILEIGYGGGRILAAASRAFGRSIGVDIHDRQDLVADALRRRGIANFSLQASDGTRLPCPDGSVDAVYSFIVFQHLERIAIWNSYIRESHRVLKPGGVALLYFGRWAPLSLNRSRPWAYFAERLLEPVFLPGGFRELPAKVNDTNLLVSLSYARRQCRQAGFRIRKTLVSRKRVPDGLNLFGSQHGLLVEK